MKKMVLLFVAVQALVACAKENKSESHRNSYELSENGCSTGAHEFSSGSDEDTQRQICSALQDEELNKGCAQDLRRIQFEETCPGQTFTPKY